MMPMSEWDLLSRTANGRASADVIRETLEDFLRSHGFEDAARIIPNVLVENRWRLEELRDERNAANARAEEAEGLISVLEKLAAGDDCTVEMIRKQLEDA